MKCDTLIKHSHNTKISGISFAILLFSLLLIAPGTARAQMFSVGGQEGPRFNAPNSRIYLGLEPIEVYHTGGVHALVVPSPTGRFGFRGSLLRLGYESRSLTLYMGAGGDITGIDNVSYFDIGGSMDLGFSLYKSSAVSIRLPVQVGTRFVNMMNSRYVSSEFNRFRFGSLTAGAGGEFIIRPAEDIRIEASALPKYGFAFASGGLFGGSVGTVEAHGRIHFDRIYGKYGLSVGYSYDSRNYDIDENAYDYRMQGHILELGITF